ncbi:PaaI family thioesterase [Saxibacter everestensis]|uniref:PaaI family thioesterase n=1 Tax=Saxibacter everestensis TaxID=2909229 RepID=A0ABY8QNV0_9MICO|nr:PaaI family thioesterase [Brevibacteriaceae bacterium ZFBP1038]
MTTPDADPSSERSRTIHYQVPGKDKRAPFARSGLEQLQAVAAGEAPAPPISSHIGLEIVTVGEGDVVMTAVPDESHYNPIGSVHGGFFATVLDSVCGCAVHSTLPAGVGYTSLEIKVSFLRPVTADTGPVTAHGWVIRAGRSVAFADADIRDQEGRVLATASSTCLIIRPAACP